MPLLDDLRIYLRDNVDAYDETPDYVKVEPSEDDTFTATGSWWQTRESSSSDRWVALPDSDDDEDPTEIPVRDTHDVTLTGDLKNRVEEEFDRFDHGIAVPMGTLDTPSLCESTADEGMATHIDADLSFMALLARDFDRDLPTEPADALATALQDIDPDVTPDQFVDVEFTYSDHAPVELVNVDVTVTTSSPHRYYSNVESREDYIERGMESDRMDIDPEAETFEVWTRLRMSEDDLPEDLVSFAEEQLQYLVEGTVAADLPYICEGNYLGYLPDGTEMTAFLHVPVSDA